MVQIQIRYEGELHCAAVHGPSKTAMATDAPVDNQGRGESFSPTDLVATALGTCMLTTMGIVAKRHGWNLDGATATVEKVMVADPVRRIGKLDVKIQMPAGLDARARETLDKTARTCPVHKSLAPAVEIPIVFEWGADAAQSRTS
jgi:putative redox protein